MVNQSDGERITGAVRFLRRDTETLRALQRAAEKGKQARLSERAVFCIRALLSNDNPLLAMAGLDALESFGALTTDDIQTTLDHAGKSHFSTITFRLLRLNELSTENRTAAMKRSVESRTATINAIVRRAEDARTWKELWQSVSAIYSSRSRLGNLVSIRPGEMKRLHGALLASRTKLRRAPSGPSGQTADGTEESFVEELFEHLRQEVLHAKLKPPD